MNGFEKLFDLLKKEEKRTGSDYTGTVTKVDGQIAYVRIDGAEISDTPVALSIDASPGDKVRVRVNNGRAWLTGNDTSPPGSNGRLVIAPDGNKLDADMGNRPAEIVIDNGTISFRSNSLVIDSNNLKLDRQGNAIFSGQLDAAGGTFSGKVTIDWPSGWATVNIGNPNFGQPIHIKSYDDEDMTTIGIDTIYISHEVGNESYSTTTTSGMFYVVRGGSVSKWAYLDVDGVHTSSDRRLKTNIREIETDIVKRLHPVQFRYLNTEEDRYGFIAQEVQEIFPEAVAEGKDGHLSLNYSELIAPLTALVLDQEKRITELEKTVAELKEALDGNNTN